MKRLLMLVACFLGGDLLGAGVSRVFTDSLSTFGTVGLFTGTAAVIAAVLVMRRRRKSSDVVRADARTVYAEVKGQTYALHVEEREDNCPSDGQLQRTSAVTRGRLRITPESHVLMEVAGPIEVFFPRCGLDEDQLKRVAGAVRMVMDTLYVRDPIRKQQNLFSRSKDYIKPVGEYLLRHPAAGKLQEVDVRMEDNRLVVDGRFALSAKKPELLDPNGDLKPSIAILKVMSDIASAGDVAYLEVLAYGKGDEPLPEPWKPATFWVSRWWDSSNRFCLRGSAVTLLERMGFSLDDDDTELVLPAYFHKDAHAPYDPKIGYYEQWEHGAAWEYLNRWLNPSMVLRKTLSGVSAGSASHDHSSVYFPPPERCLFIDKDGTVTLGPPTSETVAQAKEVDGYAVGQKDGWASPSDLYGDPASYEQVQKPYVFHPLALRHFFFDTLRGNREDSRCVRRAIYRPDSGVEFLGREEKLRTYLSKLIPCDCCGRNRKTAGECAADHCRGHFCEHCVVQDKFCSRRCAERTRDAEAKKSAIAGFTKL